jgi:hypothetical protein
VYAAREHCQTVKSCEKQQQKQIVSSDYCSRLLCFLQKEGRKEAKKNICMPISIESKNGNLFITHFLFLSLARSFLAVCLSLFSQHLSC